MEDEGRASRAPSSPCSRSSPAASRATAARRAPGLGLAIARGFLEAQGGRVEADNRTGGKGARVRLSAPLARPPHSPHERAHDAGDPATVLVVEDDASLSTALAATLKAAGFRPVTARTAAEGLRWFAHYAPDLVLLDLGLPDRDGLSVIAEIRAPAARPRSSCCRPATPRP